MRIQAGNLSNLFAGQRPVNAGPTTTGDPGARPARSGREHDLGTPTTYSDQFVVFVMMEKSMSCIEGIVEYWNPDTCTFEPG